MKPLEMIAEWRKGCSCAGPAYEQAFGKPEGSSSAAECIACTEGLIDALERALSDPTGSMVAAAIEAHRGGLVNVPDAKNSRGFTTKFRPMDAMRAALRAMAGVPAE